MKKINVKNEKIVGQSLFRTIHIDSPENTPPRVCESPKKFSPPGVSYEHLIVSLKRWTYMFSAEQQVRRAQLYGDKRMLEAAQRMKRPSCTRLHELIGG